MATRGSKLSRAVSFFRECDMDEGRVAFQLVKEIMDERLGDNTTKVKDKVRKKRRTKAQIAAQRQMEMEAPTMAANA